MVSAAVQFYEVVVFFHITAVVLSFGPTFAYAVFINAAAKRGGRAIPAVGEAIHNWDRVASTAGVLVILASGVYLTADRWEFSEFFVSSGFLAIIVLAGLAHGFFIPRTKQLVEWADRDIKASPGEGPVSFSEDFQRLSEQMNKVGPIAGLVVILAIYIMTAKPFL